MQGKGSTFYFSITTNFAKKPKTNKKILNSNKSMINYNSEESNKDIIKTNEPIRILLADDVKLNRKLAKILIHKVLPNFQYNRNRKWFRNPQNCKGTGKI